MIKGCTCGTHCSLNGYSMSTLDTLKLSILRAKGTITYSPYSFRICCLCEKYVSDRLHHHRTRQSLRENFALFLLPQPHEQFIIKTCWFFPPKHLSKPFILPSLNVHNCRNLLTIWACCFSFFLSFFICIPLSRSILGLYLLCLHLNLCLPGESGWGHTGKRVALGRREIKISIFVLFSVS